MHWRRQEVNNSERCKIRISLFIAGLIFIFSAPSALAANGCCLKTNPPSQTCSDPACTLLCFSMPDYASCQKLDNGYQWNSGTCFSLSQCADKLPHSCCVKTEGDKTTCIAAYREEQCQALGATFSVAGCNTGTNSAKCAGNYEDPAVAGDAKPVSGSSGGTLVSENITPTFTEPKLAIKIPNLSFSQLVVVDEGQRKYVDIPWIAQYLQGIYSYVLGAVSLLAVTMLVWGGVKWLTAGGDSSQVSAAKTTIGNSVIGLVLALSSYLILYTINPDAVKLKPVSVDIIKRQRWVESADPKTQKALAEKGKKAPIQNSGKSSPVPSCPTDVSCKNTNPMPTSCPMELDCP